MNGMKKDSISSDDQKFLSVLFFHLLQCDAALVSNSSGLITIFLILHAQNDLWGTVVSGHHVGGHHEVSAGCPSQAKIQDL